jgi:transposase
VEVFEQIRREYEFGVGMIAGVSRKLGVHQRMVREALRSAEPAAPKPQQRRLRKLDAVSDFIDQVLRADISAPPKQRHTARRIFDRLCGEVPGFSGRERSVRGYVQRRRQQLGLEHREVFVPQTYEWGSEAQVDWYEAWAVLSGERVKLQVFEMRSRPRAAPIIEPIYMPHSRRFSKRISLRLLTSAACSVLCVTTT